MKGAKTIHGHLVMVDKLAKSKGIEVPHASRQPAASLHQPTVTRRIVI